MQATRQDELAARAYTMALEAPMQDRCVAARLNLARVYFRLREYPLSMVHYTQWIKSNPDDEEVLREYEIVKQKYMVEQEPSITV